jgi:hypothetical protein
MTTSSPAAIWSTFTDPDTGATFYVRVRLADTDGMPVAIGLEIRGDRPGDYDGPAPDSSGEVAPITATMLRKVKVGAMVRTAANDAGMATGPERGSRGLSVDHYREVAKLYVTTKLSGESGSMAVADRWKVKRTTASQWIHRARHRYGFIKLESGQLAYDPWVSAPEPKPKPGKRLVPVKVRKQELITPFMGRD